LRFKDKSPALIRKRCLGPNAELVSLTMTCLGYLIIWDPLPLPRSSFTHIRPAPSLLSPYLGDVALVSLTKVSFLVARLKYAPVLHYHHDSTCESQW